MTSRACGSFPIPLGATMYGRTYMGNERSTFLIDADGKISHIFRKVKPAEHDAQVLAALTDA
jgi:peroxiredoxin Q/BCP